MDVSNVLSLTDMVFVEGRDARIRRNVNGRFEESIARSERTVRQPGRTREIARAEVHNESRHLEDFKSMDNTS